MAKNFDRIAPVYNILTRTIFGNALTRAQCHFLSYINPDDTILILGGGEGTFLKELLLLRPMLRIDYIDLSPRMIALAKQKTPSGSNVNFIVGTENDIPNARYSVIITNFYLDLFSDKTLKTIIKKIKCHVQQNTRWLATDFVHEKGWHHLMLWIMYRFFRMVTGIEAKQLPHWQQYLATAMGGKVIRKNFYGGFVTATVFYQ